MNAITGIEIIDWQNYALLAKEDPRGSGFFVTAMLLSTLIPTVLHMLIALISFCLPSYPRPWRTWLIKRLRNKEFQRDYAPQGVLGEAIVLVSMVAAPIMLFALVCFGILMSIKVVYKPAGEILFNVAMWAGSLHWPVKLADLIKSIF